MNTSSIRPVTAVRLVVLLLIAGLLAVGAARADGGRDDGRERYRGLVHSVPEGRIGTWVIGARTVTSDAATELDETEGPLVVGACAKVDLRRGRVHEIDSEPQSDCG